jgi:hypothetical protein
MKLFAVITSPKEQLLFERSITAILDGIESFLPISENAPLKIYLEYFDPSESGMGAWELFTIAKNNQRHVLKNSGVSGIAGCSMDDFMRLLIVRLDHLLFALTSGNLRTRIDYEKPHMFIFWNRRARAAHNEVMEAADAACEREITGGSGADDL